MGAGGNLQENPWDFVQDAFRRLADGKTDGNAPLSLESLVPVRPALLDKVVDQTPVECSSTLLLTVESMPW